MAGAEESEKEILEAYLGWAVKWMLSRGNEAFSHYRHRFERMKPLADTITPLVFALEAKDPFTRLHSAEVSRLAHTSGLRRQSGWRRTRARLRNRTAARQS